MSTDSWRQVRVPQNLNQLSFAVVAAVRHPDLPWRPWRPWRDAAPPAEAHDNGERSCLHHLRRRHCHHHRRHHHRRRRRRCPPGGGVGGSGVGARPVSGPNLGRLENDSPGLCNSSRPTVRRLRNVSDCGHEHPAWRCVCQAIGVSNRRSPW